MPPFGRLPDAGFLPGAGLPFGPGRLAPPGLPGADAEPGLRSGFGFVIWGKEDRILPVDHAGSLPNQVQVKILEDGGHMVQMESATEVNKLITDFWKD